MRAIATSLSRWALVFVAALAVLAVLPHAAMAASAGGVHLGPSAILGLGAFGAMGAMKYPTQASSYDALFANANVTNASVPEAIPWIYYDQQTFAQAGSTSVNFFAATQSDLTKSNIEQPNTIAGEKYFMLYAITFDFQMGKSDMSSSVAATQLDDARIIMETARATLTLTLADKLIFRIPLAACHAIGGYAAWVAGSNFSGSVIFNSAQNMPSDGAWWCDGAIILPPRQSFQFNVQLVTSALTAARDGRLSLHGVSYRPVR